MDNAIRQAVEKLLARMRGNGLRANTGLALHGHLTVRREDGSVMFEGGNTIVQNGMEAIVDALVAAAYINTFKYVAFGTNNSTTGADDAALGAELSGGTYARLTATQGEGDNAREYRLTGTWTNNSSSNPAVVTEYGIFGAASTGTMLARICDLDDAQVLTKTVATGETIAVTWDIQLADA